MKIDHDKLIKLDKTLIKDKFNCADKSGKFDDTTIKGKMTIDSLLLQPFEKHVGSFEIPQLLKGLLEVDQINAIVSWYIKWKLTTPVEQQTTCTIIDEFGYIDGSKAIIAINLYKYLRKKAYEPNIVEKFLNT
jgi:hypothetical protein